MVNTHIDVDYHDLSLKNTAICYIDIVDLEVLF